MDFPGKSTGVGCHCLLQLICLPSSYQEQALVGPEGASVQEEHHDPSPPGARGKTGLQTPTAPGWGGGHENTPSTLHPPQHFSCEGDWQGREPGSERKARNGVWEPHHHRGALGGPAEGGQGVNSRENSDKWAPPSLPLPPIKAKPSQRRCRNHFQARHDINISAISGGQWGVRLIEKHRWIRPAPDTQADGKYHCLSAVS